MEPICLICLLWHDSSVNQCCGICDFSGFGDHWLSTILICFNEQLCVQSSQTAPAAPACISEMPRSLRIQLRDNIYFCKPFPWNKELELYNKRRTFWLVNYGVMFSNIRRVNCWTVHVRVSLSSQFRTSLCEIGKIPRDSDEPSGSN